MDDEPGLEQVAVAQEQLSTWLAYPTELAARPDEIQPVGSAEVATEEGPADMFIFRFRTREPHWAAHNGWMIGVAGPYVRSQQPTREGHSYTFSALTPEDEKSLDEHVRELTGLVARFRGGPGR